MKTTLLRAFALFSAAWLCMGGAKADDAPSQNSDGVYQIGSAADLVWFSSFVNTSTSNVTAKAVLTADIDMSGVANFTPIGLASASKATHDNNKYAYQGIFDGQGHTISNLTISVDDTEPWQAGLFSRVFRATIKNIMLNTVSITQTSATASAAGALIGRNGSSYVTNCAALNVSFTQKTSKTSTSAATSGLVGYMSDSESSIITNCYTNYATLNVKGEKGVINNSYCGDEVTTKAASGELCYLLNENSSENPVWFQAIGTDAYPVLNSTRGTVYKNGTLKCDGTDDAVSYANTGTGLTKNDHSFNEGVCSVCELGFKNGIYELSRPSHLTWFSSYVNEGNLKINAVLTADIDMTSVPNFTPIGKSVMVNDDCRGKTAYAGNFDGQGHTISNLSIVGKENGNTSLGLFSRAYSTGKTTIKNLMLKDVVIVTAQTTPVSIGGIIGHVDGIHIEDCGVVGITISHPNYSDETTSTDGDGGVWGYVVNNTYGKLTNCYTDFKSCGRQSTKPTYTNLHAKTDFDTKATTGELCYLLNGDQTEIVWKQTLDTDDYPVLNSSHGTVYKATSATTDYYYNDAVASMTLTDAEDYAADADFTVGTLTYDRTLETDGYHSLCLPFAITTSKLPSGSKLFTVSAVGTDAVTLNEVDEVAAGTPCFASVTSDFNFNTLTLKSVPMVASVNNSGAIKGTFTEITGAGAVGVYKLDSNGEYFAKTVAVGGEITDAPVIKPFRSYIAGGASSVKTLNILLSDGTITGLTPALSEEREAVIYDLAGRRVEKATKGLYIINGKKVMK